MRHTDTVCMAVPVLPQEVKAHWGYFTFNRTQLLGGYVVSTICRDNDLEVSGRAHDFWLGLTYSSHNADKKPPTACQH